LSQVNSAHHQVGSPGSRRDRSPELLHQRFPPLAFNDRDLPAAALIRIADQSPAGNQAALAHLIHLAPMSPLDPDRFETTGQ
jgi:hypothetical protein